MQRLMEEEEEEEGEGEGSSTFEKWYQKRPELARKVEEFRRFYQLLADHVTTPITSSPEIRSLSDSPITADDDAIVKEMMPCSMEIARSIEYTICELARRNEEKRAAKKELETRIKKLIEENRGLRDQLRETMFENVELNSKINSSSSLSLSASTEVGQKRSKNGASRFLTPTPQPSQSPPPQRLVVKISNGKSNISKLRSLFFGRCIAQNRLVLDY